MQQYTLGANQLRKSLLEKVLGVLMDIKMTMSQQHCVGGKEGQQPPGLHQEDCYQQEDSQILLLTNPSSHNSSPLLRPDEAHPQWWVQAWAPQYKRGMDIPQRDQQKGLKGWERALQKFENVTVFAHFSSFFYEVRVRKEVALHQVLLQSAGSRQRLGGPVPQPEALQDCQLTHISCQGATQGENASDLSACVPTELGFCYLTQRAQPKLSQIAQTLFVHGSEQHLTWEEAVFHYIVTYILL